MRKQFAGLAVLSTLLTSCSTGSVRTENSLAIIGGRVWTGVSARPWAEGVLIEGDRIVLAGTEAEVREKAPSGTRFIDASGKMVVPGFIDTHIHFLEGGFRLASVQLREAGSREEFARRIQDYAASVPAGTWITGGDWDHENWGGALPDREWIDSLTPDHPVWVSRLDGHMSLANSRALALAGVTELQPDVEGGTVVRDDARLTGVLKDNAMYLVDRFVPPPDMPSQQRALHAAMSYVASNGVTSIHHMGGWNDLDVFRTAHRDEKLKTRIHAAVPLSTWERLAAEVKAKGPGDAWLRSGSLKGYVDGSLGSHTAAMFDDFSDKPGDRGLLVETEENLRTTVTAADREGLQVCVHAIGDRAINLQLNIFEATATKNGARDRRFRIEHAQHIAPADLPRFRILDVIASMQPYHAIDDGRWAEKVIGTERIKTTYAFRSLLKEGARVSFGSDWFVAPPTPLEGIYAAVTRRTLDDENPNGWVPEERISVEEALAAYTRDAAYAMFVEGERGTIESGKLADLVIIDCDITRIAPEKIREAKVITTIVGGNVIFEKPRAASP